MQLELSLTGILHANPLGLSSTENPRRDFRDYKQHLPAFKNFPPLNYNIDSLHQNHHGADFSSASHFHSGYLYTSAIGLHLHLQHLDFFTACVISDAISSNMSWTGTAAGREDSQKVLQTTMGLGWACILSKCFVNSVLIQRTYRDLLQALTGAWPS